ncbi:MAG: terpene cyclase/mutase family protein [Planctomycetes bacterium]|nr:terpene cyclase/mutase family protein [Planctomycetota bacterium]
MTPMRTHILRRGARARRCATVRRPRGRPIAAAACAAAVLTLLAGAARADTASPALAKYQEALDTSLDRALAYLAKEQQSNGCWSRDGGRGGQRNATGITSLALMAFLAKGHTPGVGPYGETINKGIDFILQSQQTNGMLIRGDSGHGPMYSHNISTLMLSEVSGMVDPERQAKIDVVLPKALKVIISAQQMPKDERSAGGWRYQVDSRDSDISCTGWAIMALRSARNNGAVVPKDAIDRGLAYVMKCQDRNSGGFAYQPGGAPGWGRTGTALLILELCGRHRDRYALAAGEWILRHLPRRIGDGEHFSYALYYCAQGTFQLGDDYWDRFAAQLYDIMLKAQDTDGSWPTTGENEGEGGRYYTTSMAVLAMSVSYRQLPIYQR